MMDGDDRLADYATEPVPDHRLVGAMRIALVTTGGGIALPGFLSGAQIGLSLGIEKALVAFLCGGLVLAIMASMTAAVGAQARLSTYMLVQFAFGPAGARLVNLVLAATMFGWFGVNAELFGRSAQQLAIELYGVHWPTFVYVLIGSGLMISTSVFGFRALNRLSLVAVPLVLATLVTVCAASLSGEGVAHLFAPQIGAISLGVAISAVIGGNMVMVAAIPDISRYAASPRKAALGVVIAFALGGPLILTCAAIPSIITGEQDLLLIILGVGLGVPAVVALVMSAWSTNAQNLYGAGLGLSATFPKIAQWKLTLAAGAMGTVVALSGIISYFVPFLLVLGAVVTPIAAIYLLHFLNWRRRGYHVADLATLRPVSTSAMAAWALGAATGLLTYFTSLRLTGIPTCDSLIVAMVAYLVFERFGQAAAGDRRTSETAP